ncbi:transporter substrate-binding domain-containing protein [Legionella israelensis]|uniref:transporter substrate-binding domain-containing protein n=1 Tax=Legionella israelensis TaxID=454 RepID=UPI00117F3F45|nr:transporter substrate-binding domain-containing protein [Legionella israelensis]QDP71595.1 transporter substrate-binding domain-containing protein [Legionella israelensis]
MLRTLILILLFSLSTINQAAVLRIGVPAFDPPFDMQADKNQHLSGFDVELMMEICRRLKKDCRFIPSSFVEIFQQLSKRKVDLIIGAISITAERQKKYLFSLPYMASYGQFINKNKAINKIKEIRGQRVGVLAGSLYEQLVSNLFNNDVEVVRYKLSDNIIDALMNDEIDAALMDEAASQYWKAANSAFNLVGKPIKVGVGFGIVANKDQIALIKQINHALIDMEADGTYLKIYKRYFD